MRKEPLCLSFSIFPFKIHHKMSLIQQELQDLKIQLEAEGKHKHIAGETKIIRKIDFLKEQFRELLVESRQRRAAEQENAMILSEDDPVIQTWCYDAQ